MNSNLIERIVFETEEQWLDFRKNLFTSSKANSLMAPAKRKMNAGELLQREKGSKALYIEDPKLLSTGAVSYILETIQNVESLPTPMWYNAAMQWGKETEPPAVIALCDLLGVSITDNDVIHTSIGGHVFFYVPNVLGGTPDMILKDAITEIKCPNSDVHLYYKLFVNAENLQSELPVYYDQMQLNMWLTKRNLCYFFSFDPRFKNPKLQGHLLEIKADEKRQYEILNKITTAYEYKLNLLKTLND